MWPMQRENPDKIRNPMLAAVSQPEVRGRAVLNMIIYGGRFTTGSMENEKLLMSMLWFQPRQFHGSFKILQIIMLDFFNTLNLISKICLYMKKYTYGMYLPPKLIYSYVKPNYMGKCWSYSISSSHDSCGNPSRQLLRTWPGDGSMAWEVHVCFITLLLFKETGRTQPK